MLSALRSHDVQQHVGKIGPLNVNDFLLLDDPSTVQSALKLLEAQMALIHSVHAQLRTRFPRALSRLPPEILTDIFRHVAFERNQRIFLPSHGDIFGHRRRLAFTFVCQRWRHVALSSPILWSKPDFYKPALGMMYLLRSGTIPLDLDVTLSGSAHSRQHDVVASALEQWPRIRSLKLECSPDTLAIRFGSKLFQTPSIIERLKIKLESSAHRDQYVFTGEAFRTAPALRILRLHACQFNWGSLNLPNLTKLVVVESHYAHDIPWPDFLQTLQALPLLKVLEVGPVHLRPWVPIGSPKIIAHLPQLTRLAITGRQDELCGIMQQAVFASDCDVRFSSPLQGPEDMMLIEDEDDTLCSALLAYMTHRELDLRPHTTLRALAICFDDSQIAEDELPRVAFALSADPASEPTLRLIVSGTVPFDRLCAGADGTSAWAQRIDVVTVDVHIWHFIGHIPMHFDGMENLRSVHTLHLRSGAFLGFIERLGLSCVDAESELRRHFPALQTLVISSVALAYCVTCHDGPEVGPPQKVPCALFLYWMLCRRAELGERLGELRFEHCDGYADFRDRFQGALAGCVGKLTGWGASKTPESIASRSDQ